MEKYKKYIIGIAALILVFCASLIIWSVISDEPSTNQNEEGQAGEGGGLKVDDGDDVDNTVDFNEVISGGQNNTDDTQNQQGAGSQGSQNSGNNQNNSSSSDNSQNTGNAGSNGNTDNSQNTDSSGNTNSSDNAGGLENTDNSSSSDKGFVGGIPF